MEIRRAEAGDLERLIDIHFMAFPDDQRREVVARYFTKNPLGRLEDVLVAEIDGEVAGHAFLFPLRASFGGVKVKLSGIASIGVAAEHRGRGVASALLERAHGLSEKRRDAITMLYPFRQGFYLRHGYATVSSRKRVVFDPAAVPEAWRRLARERVRAARGGDRADMARVHARFAARSSGVIVRSDALWDRLLAREDVVRLVCTRGHELSGALALRLVQERFHGPTAVHVDELVADDAESRRALLGSVGALRDQAEEVLLEIAEDDPLERALVDLDRRRFGTPEVEHGLGEIVGGPMVRITEPVRALEARGYLADGRFDIAIPTEAPAPLAVVVRGGRAKVEPVRGRGKRAVLVTDRVTLAALLYGSLSARAALDLGMIRETPGAVDAAARFDAVAALPPVTPVDPF